MLSPEEIMSDRSVEGTGAEPVFVDGRLWYPTGRRLPIGAVDTSPEARLRASQFFKPGIVNGSTRNATAGGGPIG